MLQRRRRVLPPVADVRGFVLDADNIRFYENVAVMKKVVAVFADRFADFFLNREGLPFRHGTKPSS